MLGDDADIQGARPRARRRRETDGADVDPEPVRRRGRGRRLRRRRRPTSTLFLRRFRPRATPQEELRFLYVLADFDDAELVDRLLAMASPTRSARQNAPYLLRRAMTNRDQGQLAWSFVQDHWDAINERFPSNSIVRMLEGIRSLSDPDVAHDVFVFFETHEVPQGDKPSPSTSSGSR